MNTDIIMTLVLKTTAFPTAWHAVKKSLSTITTIPVSYLILKSVRAIFG